MNLKSIRSANSILGFIPHLKDEQGRQTDKTQLISSFYVNSQAKLASQAETDANSSDMDLIYRNEGTKVTECQTISVKEEPEKLHPLDILQLVKEVEEDSYTFRSIAIRNDINPSNPKDLEERHCIISQLKQDFQRNSEGCLEVMNPDVYKKHKELIGGLLQEFKSVLMSGKSLRTISLPLCLYEPRSILERVAGTFRYAPSLLKKAGEKDCPLQQFKLSLAYWIASLHTNVSLEKPFTPRTGETFQCYIGECPVHMEQISRHPSICLFQVYGQNFQLEGSYEFASHIGANHVKINGYGYPRVRFYNTNVTIYVQQPCFNMSGIVYGNKTSYLSNRTIVFDLENRYYVEINFDGTSNWFKKKSAIDVIKTSIWKVKDDFVKKIKRAMKEKKELILKFNEKEDAEEELCKVEGSWLEHLTIDGERLWALGKDMPHKIRYIENPLPSDSNFRLDVLHLKLGNEEKAQECKFALDDIERNHKKLRENFHQDNQNL